MSAAEEVLYFQSVGIAEGKSFEEIRIEDYIKSYQTTGRPPQPVPPDPKDENQRKAMGLPPLFQAYIQRQPRGGTSVTGGAGGTPFSLSSGGGGGGMGGSTTMGGVPASAQMLQPLIKVAITDPNDLPLGQEWRERIVQGERYQSVGAMAAYEAFSHEELRYYAYARGHRNAPVPVLMVPFSLSPGAGVSAGARQGAGSGVGAGGGAQEDRLENISAQPGYDSHSPEEFRVAFLLFHRELTSAELFQLQNPNPNPNPQPNAGLQLQPPLALQPSPAPLQILPAPTPSGSGLPFSSSSALAIAPPSVSAPAAPSTAFGGLPSALPQPIFSAGSASTAGVGGTQQATVPRFTFGLR